MIRDLTSGLFFIVIALTAAVIAQNGQAFTLHPSGAGGSCLNNNFVVNSSQCSACINTGLNNDVGLADCRNCCSQLTGGAPGTLAHDRCRTSNGC